MVLESKRTVKEILYDVEFTFDFLFQGSICLNYFMQTPIPKREWRMIFTGATLFKFQRYSRRSIIGTSIVALRS